MKPLPHGRRARWLSLGADGLVAIERIVAIGPAESAPMRRLTAVTPDEQIIILTGGQRRQCILILDSGHLIVTALSLRTVQRLLHSANSTPIMSLEGENSHEY